MMHVYFSNDASLQKSDVSESDSSSGQDCSEVWLLLTLSLVVNLMLVIHQTFSIINHHS